MRKIVLLIISIFCFYVAGSQNLVPNGDFEQFYSCPNMAGQLTKTKFWFEPSIGSSDYFNACGTGFANVPYAFGTPNFQLGRSGVAYTGMLLFHEALGLYREYIEIALDSTLIAGTCYDFDMYFNLCNNSKYTVSTIGVYFSDTMISGVGSSSNLPFTPQIVNNPSNFPDSLNWTLISSNYIAVGGENYLIIGNYYDDLNTDTATVSPSGNAFSYIFIDDVSLKRCLPGGIHDFDSVEPVAVYPNPSSGRFNFKGLKENCEIDILNIVGETILKVNGAENFLSIDISDKSKGLYFYRITSGTKLIQRGKILLN